MSAAWTGRSFESLNQMIAGEALSPDQFGFIALYKLHVDVSLRALCDLSVGMDGEAFEMINEPGSRTVVDIDRRTYFPLHVRDMRMSITKAAAMPVRVFFDKYQGTGAIRLHCDAVDLNSQRLRHHAVDVDVEAMLRVTDFDEALRGELLRMECVPDAIVAPPHHAGERLLEAAVRLARERFGIEPATFIHPDLSLDASDTPRELIGNLPEDALVLIIDDFSCRGQRLKRYQVNLRELRYRGRIRYLIGVARPESEEVWDERNRRATYARQSVSRTARRKSD